MAMVLRANKDTNVGGHIASFASAATLYDVGFNHFWHAASDAHGGDLRHLEEHERGGDGRGKRDARLPPRHRAPVFADPPGDGQKCEDAECGLQCLHNEPAPNPAKQGKIKPKRRIEPRAANGTDSL